MRHTHQENRELAALMRSSKVQFAAGDFNLAVSTKPSACHEVMDQISTKNDLKYMPSLAYHHGILCEECVSNVHVRCARQCYDMCLVPETNETFSAKFFSVPGDLSYLLALQAVVAEEPTLNKGHVVTYYNRKRFDHRTMLIESW